jgi:hypothetical protein
VHIDVAAAETGVSRFAEAWSTVHRHGGGGGGGSGWQYSKAEGLAQPAQYASFDYLLTENATRHAEYFDVLEAVPSFLRLDWRSLSLVRAPRLYIMRRRQGDARAVRVEGVLSDMQAKLRSARGVGAAGGASGSARAAGGSTGGGSHGDGHGATPASAPT